MSAEGACGERRCFCLRRANPFLGLVAIVKTTGARALSFEGRSWQIQVLAHPPRGLWSREGSQDRLQYFRFGLWSKRLGIRSVPLNPILDTGRMLAESEELIELLHAHHRDLPFPLADELELWLLDRNKMPLALLATALEGTDLDELGTPTWSAGSTRERPFVSATLRCRAQAASADETPPMQHATALERLVRSAAGRHLNRQWFRRNADGSRLGLGHRSPEGLAGRRLPPKVFGDLPLQTDWQQDRDRRLAADWIDWIAPYLLTLPGIDDRRRERLERQAVRDPLLVDALWRLYPKVLNPGLLRRARVEAQLRRANA